MLSQARLRAADNNVDIKFKNADFCSLSDTFDKQFDIIIAMDNALPHMLSKEDLAKVVKSITNQLKDKGIFVGSIRDYDALLKNKPPYSAPYIYKTDKGQRVSFQIWEWNEDCYKLIRYIVDDSSLKVSRFDCEYRATRREELTDLFISEGCKDVIWKFPEETEFYQPVIIVRK